MSGLNFNRNPIKKIKLNGDINHCCFNIYNSLAIGTSDKVVSVWDWTDDGFQEADYSPLLRHKYPIVGVKFTPNGLSLITTSSDGMTFMFNAKTGIQEGCIVQSLGGGVRDTAVGSDELFGTVTDDGYLFLWNTKYQKMCRSGLELYINHPSIIPTRYWFGHEAGLSSLAFSPDMFLEASGDSDGNFKLWFVEHSVSQVFTVDMLCGYVQKDAHDGGVLTIAFSSKSFNKSGSREYEMCSGGNDNLLKLWHVSTGYSIENNSNIPFVYVELLKVLLGHRSSVTQAKFSPDGCYIASTSLDRTVRIWEVSTGNCVDVLEIHSHSVFCCAFSPRTDFFASGSNDKNIHIWKVKDGTIPVLEYPTHAADSNYFGEILEGKSCTVMDQIFFGGFHVNSISFNINNDLAVGSSDKVVKCFAKTGTVYKEIIQSKRSHDYSVVSVEFSKCGRHLVSCSIDGTVQVTNCGLGSHISKPFLMGGQGGRAARFSPASDLLALGCYDGKVYLWSMQKKDIHFGYTGHVESVNSLAFTPDGEYLATGCTGGHLKLWRTSPACNICQLLIENVHDLGITSADFSQGITVMKATRTKVYRLATGGTDSVVKVFKIWPVDETSVDHQLMFNMLGHRASITKVCFSNKFTDVLASSSIDSTTRIWNMQNGEALCVLGEHKNQVTTCAFSADAHLLATGSLDSTVIIYEISRLISLHSRYTKEDSAPPAATTGLPLDNDELRLDDVTLSLEDLMTDFKRSSAEIPDHFMCPITQQIMTEPVVCDDGFTYEKHAIESWILKGRSTSPMTNVPLSSTIVVPNKEVETEIRRFLLKHYNEEHKFE